MNKLNVASSRYRCDGADLACNAQEDAESNPSEKLVRMITSEQMTVSGVVGDNH